MDRRKLEGEMAAVLSAARDLTLRSRLHGWPDEDPSEAAAVLDQMLLHLVDRSKPVPQFACIYFAPTGPLQEIAIANGWHGDYLELASQYDTIEAQLCLFPAGA